MNKMQAYHSFWNGFGLKAYDETSVPDEAQLPYITYEAANDDFGYEIALSASIWYRSSSWRSITEKEMEISSVLKRGGQIVNYDGGAFWIHKGIPWAQRMTEESDDSVRRIVLNVEIEFFD